MAKIGLPSLALLNLAWETLQDLYIYSESETVFEEVAKFFESRGFIV